MQQALDIMLHLVNVFERDRVFEHTQPVPVWMTRFDLFADSTLQKTDYERRFQLAYCLLDGQTSVLQAAHALDECFDATDTYVREMYRQELVRIVDTHPTKMGS